MNNKMIMIPEERYWKMIESYDKALETIEQLKNALAVLGSEDKDIQNRTYNKQIAV